MLEIGEGADDGDLLVVGTCCTKLHFSLEGAALRVYRNEIGIYRTGRSLVRPVDRLWILFASAAIPSPHPPRPPTNMDREG